MRGTRQTYFYRPSSVKGVVDVLVVISEPMASISLVFLLFLPLLCSVARRAAGEGATANFFLLALTLLY